MAQFSAGKITHPEPHEEGDVSRMTASVHYTRPRASGNAWSTSAIWGRNHKQIPGGIRNLNSYLLETLYPLSRNNLLTARVEVVDKDDLFADNQVLEDQLSTRAGSVFRVHAYTMGYTRELGNWSKLATALGFNATVYSIPTAIQPFYGDRPWGANVFLRVRLRPQS